MEKYTELKYEYEHKLKGMIEEYKRNQHELMEDYREDEAKLCRIKENITDIFFKMFEVSLKGIDEEKHEMLYEKYMKFFDKIPSEWVRKAELDKKNNMEKEYIIEKLKLQTADEVKNMFINIYEKYYGGEK